MLCIKLFFTLELQIASGVFVPPARTSTKKPDECPSDEEVSLSRINKRQIINVRGISARIWSSRIPDENVHYNNNPGISGRY